MQRQGPATLESTVAKPPFTQRIAFMNLSINKMIKGEKVVLIAMNAALEDVYKKVFADSYQHGAPLSRRV